MENTVEQSDLLSSEVLAAIAPVQEVPSEVSVFTADDVAKAREQEKAKLYPQMEKMKEELAAAIRSTERSRSRSTRKR